MSQLLSEQINSLDATQIRSILSSLLSDPTIYPIEFKKWLPNQVSSNNIRIPIDQVEGYDQGVPVYTAGTSSSTTSTAYINIQSVSGNFSRGNYLIWVGGRLSNSAGGVNGAALNYGQDGSAAADTQRASVFGGNEVSAMRMSTVSITDDTAHTFALYAKALTGGTGVWAAPYIIVWRIASA